LLIFVACFTGRQVIKFVPYPYITDERKAIGQGPAIFFAFYAGLFSAERLSGTIKDTSKIIACVVVPFWTRQ